MSKLAVAAAAACAVVATLAPQAGVAAPAAPAAFPGTNGKIVFAGFPPDGTHLEEIYTVNPDGSGLTRLTTNNLWNNATGDVYPDWNATGRKFVFERATASSGSSLPVMNASGTVLDHVATAGCSNPQSPAWSPDGTMVAYSCGDSFPSHLYVVPSSGGVWGTPVQMTSDSSASDTEPEWSPDGTEIAFTRMLSNAAEIVEVGVTTAPSLAPGSETALTTHGDNSAIFDVRPDWSPDGMQVAFSRNSAVFGFAAEIMIKDLTSGTVTRITHSSSWYDDWPAFSPNGNQLVWARGDPNANTTDDLLIRNLSTGAVRTLTSGPRLDEEPDWGVAP